MTRNPRSTTRDHPPSTIDLRLSTHTRPSTADDTEAFKRLRNGRSTLARKERVSLARTSHDSVAPARGNVQSSDYNKSEAPHRPNVYAADALRDKSVAPE